MANYVWLDIDAYQAGADLTGASNKVQLQASAEPKVCTTFASGGWTERKGGLKSAKVMVAGFWDAGTGALPDDRAFTDLGNSIPFTLIPTGGAAGDVAYLTRAVETQYETFGQIGDMLPFTVSAVGDSPAVRGQILHPQGTARSTTGSGTAVQVGAVAAAPSRMYAALHVFSATGTTPSLTVRLQSAPASNFASPTTQITFSAANALGGQFSSVAGAITDTWWRADWTISGTTPSFLFALAVGVSTP